MSKEEQSAAVLPGLGHANRTCQCNESQKNNNLDQQFSSDLYNRETWLSKEKASGQCEPLHDFDSEGSQDSSSLEQLDCNPKFTTVVDLKKVVKGNGKWKVIYIMDDS